VEYLDLDLTFPGSTYRRLGTLHKYRLHKIRYWKHKTKVVLDPYKTQGTALTLKVRLLSTLPSSRVESLFYPTVTDELASEVE